MEIEAQPVREIHPHLDRVISVDAVARQPPFLSDSCERNRVGFVVMTDQIHPVRSHIGKWVALFDPFERARRYFEWLFEVGGPIKWLADLLFNVIEDSK